MTSVRTAVETAVLRGAMALPPAVQRALVRRPRQADGHTLSPEIQLMFRLSDLSGAPGLGERPVEDSREQMLKDSVMAGGRQPIGAIRELVVDGAEGTLPARLYIPSARFRDDSRPTLMFFHGGGMCLGDLDTYDAACRHLAERSGVQVLSIAYRLAPEHPFPAGVQDCFAAYQWLVKNAGAVDADPERLAVGGDSAGGYFAATTAIQAAEAGLPLAFQLLIYPVTDLVNRSRSRDLFDGGGLLLTRDGMDRLNDWYTPDPSDRTAPLASPLLNETLPAMAPAYVVTAGFDPLRDEGEAYGALMARHGTTVETQRFGSMAHGFVNIVGVGREARARAAEVADKLGAALQA
ncbi:MAG: alpha/beta hydrolase [Nocardioidaceae bacterium]|nr:alpha/beta hydrolase [Nocardioidaceae bacterium]